MLISVFLVTLITGCGTVPRIPAAADPAVVRDRSAQDASALRSAIAFHALSTVGTPYTPGGGSLESGFDCSGLVAYVFRRASRLELPRTTFELSRVGHQVDPADLQPGDLVFYDTQRRAYSHVGIYLGEQRFIHAPSSGGTVRIEDMGFDYWLHRFNGARRVAP